MRKTQKTPALDTEKQSQYPPSRLKGLKPFKKGESGNPGGVQKGAVFLSEALKRLMALPLAEFDAYEPKNATEKLALGIIRQGINDPDKRITAIKEIADRTEGRPKQPIEGSGSFGVTLPQLKNLLAQAEGESDEE